ncbi:MAG TPA: pyridoxamine 5'-phosphate oxidase family protein [Actinomycetota bacterium]|nr:pyridoxamine 5'-phosphate oxidase family protein [Actinomycetota bacterium]
MPLPRSMLRMTPEELDGFLREERTARVATVSASGEPHVAPLWFVWHDSALWVTSLRKSRRAADLQSGSRVAACVDAGGEYRELRGAVLYGSMSAAESEAQFDAARLAYGDKYWGGTQAPVERSHEWLVLRPDRIASWDFRKIPTGKDRRLRQAES